MSTHTCLNCNNEFTGQFCNMCGQKEVHRITMSHLWHDFVHAFTHTDKGFFYMMGQLFVRPGEVARDYIVEGKRKRYFMPLQYLIILGTIATIVVVNSHFIENTMRSMGDLTGGNSQYSARQAAFMQKINLLQSKYYNIMILLQLPFYALSAYIFYRSKKFNFAELLTLQTFVTGQHTLISMVLMLLIFITNSPNYINLVMMLASLSYQVWVYMQFFKEKTLVGFLKAIGSYLLGMLIFIVSAIILGLIIGIIIALMSR